MPTTEFPPLALQLYTVRAQTATDLLGALARVAAIGFDAVEFAGYGDTPVPDIRARLDDLGLRTIGAHVKLPDWESRPEAAVADVVALGGRYAVVPWVPEERRATLAAAQALAADLNRWSSVAAGVGLGFAYHHHDFEFAPLPDAADGRSLFDVILAETDPALVGLELDVYWAARAGHDPIALLNRHADRIPLLHAKDLGPAPAHADLPVGAGTLDWPAILAAAPNVQALIAEQDNPSDPFADSEQALRALQRLTR